MLIIVHLTVVCLSYLTVAPELSAFPYTLVGTNHDSLVYLTVKPEALMSWLKPIGDIDVSALRHGSNTSVNPSKH